VSPQAGGCFLWGKKCRKRPLFGPILEAVRSALKGLAKGYQLKELAEGAALTALRP
jgi:hypothetical protein